MFSGVSGVITIDRHLTVAIHSHIAFLFDLGIEARHSLIELGDGCYSGLERHWTEYMGGTGTLYNELMIIAFIPGMSPGHYHHDKAESHSPSKT